MLPWSFCTLDGTRLPCIARSSLVTRQRTSKHEMTTTRSLHRFYPIAVECRVVSLLCIGNGMDAGRTAARANTTPPFQEIPLLSSHSTLRHRNLRSFFTCCRECRVNIARSSSCCSIVLLANLPVHFGNVVLQQ